MWTDALLYCHFHTQPFNRFSTNRCPTAMLSAQIVLFTNYSSLLSELARLLGCGPKCFDRTHGRHLKWCGNRDHKCLHRTTSKDCLTLLRLFYLYVFVRYQSILTTNCPTEDVCLGYNQNVYIHICIYIYIYIYIYILCINGQLW